MKIVARKKAVSIKGDKIIYDVEQMGIGSANNGLETMQQLPGINLDKDENINSFDSVSLHIVGKQTEETKQIFKDLKLENDLVTGSIDLLFHNSINNIKITIDDESGNIKNIEQIQSIINNISNVFEDFKFKKSMTFK